MTPAVSPGKCLPRASWSSYWLLVRQPVESHGCRPRLLIRTQSLAREGLVVLSKAPVGELREGVALEPVRPLPFPRDLQRPPQQPVHDGPDRTAPVAAGEEARIVRAGAWRERPAEVGVAGESVRVEDLEERLEAIIAFGTGYDRCEACDGAGREGFAGPQVVVEAKAESGIPTFLEPSSPAFDPGPDQRPVLLRGADDFGHLEQSPVRLHQDRARKYVLGQKWA